MVGDLERDVQAPDEYIGERYREFVLDRIHHFREQIRQVARDPSSQRRFLRRERGNLPPPRPMCLDQATRDDRIADLQLGRPKHFVYRPNVTTRQRR